MAIKRLGVIQGHKLVRYSFHDSAGLYENYAFML